MFLWRGRKPRPAKQERIRSGCGYNKQPNTRHLYETQFCEKFSGEVGSDFAGSVHHARVRSGASFACGIAVDSIVRTIAVSAPGRAGSAKLR